MSYMAARLLSDCAVRVIIVSKLVYLDRAYLLHVVQVLHAGGLA